MIKVIAKNSQNEITHEAVFDTQEKANAWIELSKQNKAFGKEEQWYTEVGAQMEGVTLPENAESRVAGLDDMGAEVIEYKIPCDYAIEQSEYTPTVDPVQERLNKMQFGDKVVATLIEINNSKGYTAEQFGQLVADPTLAGIERLLRSGSLDLAKAAIAGYSGSWYSAEEKQNIINMINQELGV